MDAIGSPLITATGDLVTLPALVVGTLILGLAQPGLAVLGVLCLVAGVAAAVYGALGAPQRARRIVLESLPVLAYAALVDVLAGTVLETRLDAFLETPALLVLVPPFIASCGSLGGILAARLASDLHLGLIEPRWLPEKRAALDGSMTVLFAFTAFTGVGLIGHIAASIAGPALTRAGAHGRDRTAGWAAGDRAALRGRVRHGRGDVPVRPGPRQRRHPRRHRHHGPAGRALPGRRDRRAGGWNVRAPAAAGEPPPRPPGRARTGAPLAQRRGEDRSEEGGRFQGGGGGAQMKRKVRNVKELLSQAKDASELMLDLAFAAVFLDETKLAEEVMRLEDGMDEAVRELRVLCMLAARSPDDAEQLAGVLNMANCIEAIGDAAEDIARIVLRNLGVPSELRDDLRFADEVTARIRVRKGSELVGATLRGVALPSRTGMWVIARRRDLDWEHGPDPDTPLREGDVLFLQGPVEGVDLVRALAGGKPHHLARPSTGGRLSNLDRAVDILVELKNAAEAAVGLAYSAILFRDLGLVSEVSGVEDRCDELWYGLQRWVLRAAAEVSDDELDELRSLLQIGASAEAIADAAQEMTRLVEQGEGVHPVVPGGALRHRRGRRRRARHVRCAGAGPHAGRAAAAHAHRDGGAGPAARRALDLPAAGQPQPGGWRPPAGDRPRGGHRAAARAGGGRARVRGGRLAAGLRRIATSCLVGARPAVRCWCDHHSIDARSRGAWASRGRGRGGARAARSRPWWRQGARCRARRSWPVRTSSTPVRRCARRLRQARQPDEGAADGVRDLAAAARGHRRHRCAARTASAGSAWP